MPNALVRLVPTFGDPYLSPCLSRARPYELEGSTKFVLPTFQSIQTYLYCVFLQSLKRLRLLTSVPDGKNMQKPTSLARLTSNQTWDHIISSLNSRDSAWFYLIIWEINIQHPLCWPQKPQPNPARELFNIRPPAVHSAMGGSNASGRPCEEVRSPGHVSRERVAPGWPQVDEKTKIDDFSMDGGHVVFMFFCMRLYGCSKVELKPRFPSLPSLPSAWSKWSLTAALRDVSGIH